MSGRSWQDGLDRHSGRNVARGRYRGRGRGRGRGGPTWRDAFASTGSDAPSFRGGKFDGGRGRGSNSEGGDRGRGGQAGSGRGRGKPKSFGPKDGDDDNDDQGGDDGVYEDVNAWKARAREAGDAQDTLFGFARLEKTGDEDVARIGYLVNMLPTIMKCEDGVERAALDMYFLQQDGNTFKATVRHEPYFYLGVRSGTTKEAAAYLSKRFEGLISSVVEVAKEDLGMLNHLSGTKGKFLQLRFRTVSALMDVRKVVLPIVERNAMRRDETTGADVLECFCDIREYDVPYYVRVSIDLEVRVGCWYSVIPEADNCKLTLLKDMVEKAEPRVLAFDIETTKAPLKFPEVTLDRIYMISYMFDGQGYLLINREIVSEDIANFEYTPKPEYKGPFIVWNLADEEAVIKKFFWHIRQLKPQVFVTYNGDFFDWPFVEGRALAYGLSMEKEIGVKAEGSEYRGRTAVHMDCMYWVKRDSYLPQGSQGLKAVTKEKLGYDPVEIDPEDMLRLAAQRPKYMASYSVSDAVATFYLFQKYVHNFIFSLCTIIPMGADDVLRKGSGTLCEMLLMVEAFRGNIICPNKQRDGAHGFHDGHLLESESYIGGHVECLESGVFRSDLPTDFSMVPSAFQGLIDKIDRALTFALEVEGKIERDDVVNYDDVRAEIVSSLEKLRDCPVRRENPKVYHLDVAAMYPNIILTNRLQPQAMVNDAVCASCDFNAPKNNCKRKLQWLWKGDYYPATRSEFESVKAQIEYEKFDGGVAFHDLPSERQEALLKQRMKTYCQKVYKRVKDSSVIERQATICQRENPFYVNTVMAFRDRRYDYKGLTKTWTGKLAAAEKCGNKLEAEAAKARVVLYDSLQLAHKCILNSFYGYVMRRGARWHSMEMAGVVTLTGSRLITQARELIEQIGRPLELDTDGIWCVLPASFPQDFKFVTKTGRKYPISYPCVMLNADVHDNYTNHQYQELMDPSSKTYKIRSECSIFFELDGPHRAMVLPASPEEGRLLKKRYAVFGHNGNLSELKGFEMKRRGELKIIKIFQQQVFGRFLEGSTLQECYNAVGEVANYWLDVLESHGVDLEDEELLDLISENRSMSRSLAEYGEQKSTAISTAKRLAEFLGGDMVKDKGLACKLVIARKPEGTPVTERAIPTAIFAADAVTRRHFLRLWLKDSSMTDFDIRNVIDWGYYVQRLAGAIQKIITLPAALQKVDNPVPRVVHPEWMTKLVKERSDTRKQTSISSFFSKRPTGPALTAPACDVEDVGLTTPSRPKGAIVTAMAAAGRRQRVLIDEEERDSKADDLDAPVDEDGCPVPLAQADSDGDGPDDNEAEDTCIVVSTPHPAPSSAPSVHVDMRQDVQAWLKCRKEAWRAIRQQRKRERLELVGGPGGGPTALGLRKASTRKGLAGYFQDATSTITRGYWQIVEVREDYGTPGSFIVWAFTSNNRIQSVKLDVPRILYMNAVKDEGIVAQLGKQVRKILPRRMPVYHLYEVVMPERRFLRNSKEITRLMTDPGIQGVYETKTPLMHRVLMNVGCVTQLSDVGRQQLLAHPRDPISFESIDFITTTTHAYLDTTSATYRRMFLYHASCDNRAVIALYVIQDTNVEIASTAAEHVDNQLFEMTPGRREAETGHRRTLAQSRCIGGVDVPITAVAHVWVVSPGNTTRPPFRRVFDSLNQRSGVDGSTVDFRTNLVNKADQAWRGVSSVLTDYQTSHAGPAVVVAQTLLPKPTLFHLIPVLNDFPVVMRPADATDNAFPALAWHMFVANRCVARFLLSHMWWDERLEASRYCQVPVGNLGQDLEVFMADLFFSRMLQHNKYLLWASQSSLPDLGGAETDVASEGALATLYQPKPSFDWASGFTAGASDMSDLQDSAVIGFVEGPGRIVASGCYRCVCVELDLFHLAVNSVLNYTAISDMEGSDAMADVIESSTTLDGTSGSSLPVDDAQACSGAFRVLYWMVRNWFTDATTTKNSFADQLLQHFNRWVSSTSSLLYDPALQRLIRRLMTKVFNFLVAEIKKFGASVVYADSTRIVLATNKQTLDEAVTYIDYVSTTLAAQPLFQYLSLVPRRYWQQLLYLDHSNYGGVLFTEDPTRPKPVAVDVEADAQFEAERDEIVISDEDPEVGGQRRRRVAATDSGDDAVGVSESESEGGGGAKRRIRRLAPGKRDGKSKHDSVSDESEDDRFAVRFDDDDEDLDGFIVSDDDDNAQKKKDDAHTAKGAENGTSTLPEGERLPQVVSHWNLAEYLPPYVEECFVSIIGLFLLRPLLEGPALLQANTAADAAPASSASTARFGKSLLADPTMFDDEKVTPLTTFVRRLISTILAPKLHEMVKDIMHMTGPEVAFPNRPGSHIRMTNPALEFIKAVCHVLGLDSTVESQVQVLKKNLLRLIQVREFSEEVQFRDPCLTLLLPDIMCSNCNYCRDLDLARDAEWLPTSETDPAEGVLAWLCPQCRQRYEEPRVEAILVQVVQRRSMAYQVQDLYCAKCRSVRCSKLSDYCKCSGRYVNAESPERFRAAMQVFVNIAEHHGFGWLAETVNFVLHTTC